MFRLCFCLSFVCFASLAVSRPALAQDALPVEGKSVVTSPSDGGNCDCNALDGCGQTDGYFQNCNGQGCGSCGGCRQGGSVRGLIGRVSSCFPLFELNLGNCCCPRKYRSFFGGGVDLLNYEGDNGGPVIGTFRDGFVLGTARGQYLNDNTRVEMESSWRNNSGDTWTSGGTTVPFDGHFNLFSTMFNVVRDLNTNGPVNLYAGGGIGFSKQDGDFDVSGTPFSLDDWAFAFQGFGGVNVLSNGNADLFVEYRYFGNTNTDLEASGMFFDDFSYRSQNILVGIRLRR